MNQQKSNIQKEEINMNHIIYTGHKMLSEDFLVKIRFFFFVFVKEISSSQFMRFVHGITKKRAKQQRPSTHTKVVFDNLKILKNEI